MKKLLLLGAFALLSACSLAPKETYPYNISEKEWNELSVKDRARIRRDFYFYEKGTMNFVNPDLEIEGCTAVPAAAGAAFFCVFLAESGKCRLKCA